MTVLEIDLSDTFEIISTNFLERCVVDAQRFWPPGYCIGFSNMVVGFFENTQAVLRIFENRQRFGGMFFPICRISLRGRWPYTNF